MSYVLLCAKCPHEFGVYEDTRDIPDNPACPHIAHERQDALTQAAQSPRRDSAR